MIGLDSNVLVRYITQDEPQQSALATRLIENRCTKADPGYISQIVLCELIWVLGRAYRYEKHQLTHLMEQILITAELEIEGEELAWKALAAWCDGPADFSDYLLVLNNRAAGCECTFSFDNKLAHRADVSHPE